MTWDATTFFRDLTNRNRLAQEHEFRFCSVTDLDNFQEALQAMQGTKNFVCVSENESGYIQLNNTPHKREIKTVFIAMRHPVDNMVRRQECIGIIQELFRQYASVLILEQTRLQQSCIYIDPRIQLNEIDRYFFSGTACMYFQIATDIYTNLQFNTAEWDSPRIFSEQYTRQYK